MVRRNETNGKVDDMPSKGDEPTRACDESKDADGTCDRRTTARIATHTCVAVMAEEDTILGRTSSEVRGTRKREILRSTSWTRS